MKKVVLLAGALAAGMAAAPVANAASPASPEINAVNIDPVDGATLGSTILNKIIEIKPLRDACTAGSAEYMAYDYVAQKLVSLMTAVNGETAPYDNPVWDGYLAEYGTLTGLDHGTLVSEFTPYVTQLDRFNTIKSHLNTEGVTAWDIDLATIEGYLTTVESTLYADHAADVTSQLSTIDGNLTTVETNDATNDSNHETQLGVISGIDSQVSGLKTDSRLDGVTSAYDLGQVSTAKTNAESAATTAKTALDTAWKNGNVAAANTAISDYGSKANAYETAVANAATNLANYNELKGQLQGVQDTEWANAVEKDATPYGSATAASDVTTKKGAATSAHTTLAGNLDTEYDAGTLTTNKATLAGDITSYKNTEVKDYAEAVAKANANEEANTLAKEALNAFNATDGKLKTLTDALATLKNGNAPYATEVSTIEGNLSTLLTNLEAAYQAETAAAFKTSDVDTNTLLAQINTLAANAAADEFDYVRFDKVCDLSVMHDRTLTAAHVKQEAKHVCPCDEDPECTCHGNENNKNGIEANATEYTALETQLGALPATTTVTYDKLAQYKTDLDAAKTAADLYLGHVVESQKAHMVAIDEANDRIVTKNNQVRHAYEEAANAGLTGADKAAADAWAVAAGYADFEEYVTELYKKIEGTDGLVAKALEAYKKHDSADQEAVLKGNAQALLDANNWAEAVAANTAAYEAKKAQLEEMLAVFSEAYGDVYTTDLADTEADQYGLEALNKKTEVETQLSLLESEYNLYGKAATFVVPDLGVEDYKTLLKAARALKAANDAAKLQLAEAVTELEATYALFSTAYEKAKSEGALYTVDVEDTDKDALGVDAVVTDYQDALATEVHPTTGHFATLYAQGKLAAEAATELSHLTSDVKAKLLAIESKLAEAVAFKTQNVEAYNALNAQLAAVVENKATLDTEWAAVADEVYNVEGHKDNDAITALVSAIKPELLATSLMEEVAAGTIYDNKGDLQDEIAALSSSIENARAEIAKAVTFKAKSVEAYNALNEKFNDAATDLKVLVDEAAVADVYEVDGHMDATAIMTAIMTAQSNEFGPAQAAIEEALAKATVVANYDTLEEQVDALSDAVTALRTLLAEKVNFKAQNVEAAQELASLFENLKDEVTTAPVGDTYADDAEFLEGKRTELLGRIAVEAGYVTADLAAGEVLTNYATSKEAYETLLADVKGFEGMIKDYEKLLADNKEAKEAKLRAVGDVEATLNGVVLNPEALYEDDYETLYEKVEALYEQLETVQTEIVAAFNAKTAPAYEVPGELRIKLAELLGKKVELENLYAANLAGKTALLAHAQSVLTAVNTTLDEAKCAVADGCDEAIVDALSELVDQIAAVEVEVNNAFDVKKTAVEGEGTQYGVLNSKLNEIEKALTNAKKQIADFNDRVRTSQHAADNILDKMLDVNFWTTEAQVPGYEHFLVRQAHCSNPDVLYFNEIQDLVDELKSDVLYDNSHEGGHTAFDNYNSYVKRLLDVKEKLEVLKAAIQANEAAYALINERYGELYDDALDAYKFWHQYYAEQTLNDDWYTANKGWIQEWNGELEAGDYLVMLKNYFDDLYNHGNAAYEWTVDAQGKELNDAATETFEKQDTDLAKDRNDLAHKEALNHWQTVKNTVDTAKYQVWDEYGQYDYWTDTMTWDPFAANVMLGFNEEFEGEFGMIASLNTFKADIEAAYAEGVMEDAINIDEHNTALGIHQQLNGVLGVLGMVMEEYADLFAESHHLTNGKKIYSDQEYFTLGFFEKANDGSVENGQEMFDEVKVLVNDDIRLYDSRSYVWNDMGTDDWSDDEALLDEKGRVVYDKVNNPGEIAEVTVLTVGAKSNELAFNFHQNPMALERTTLKAGTAEVDFLPGSISVKKNIGMAEPWTLKHTVSIDGLDVLTPEVADMTPTVYAASNKLIVRLDAPIDLTYTINSLVARTNDGTEISYADRELNYAARQLEFTLPEGTQTVEIPEGFFTFRTGENTIARSVAVTVNVADATSIDSLVAMGEKAQIFDLQGRRVKAESLISGNTYVVNGEKVMVK